MGLLIWALAAAAMLVAAAGFPCGQSRRCDCSMDGVTCHNPTETPRIPRRLRNDKFLWLEITDPTTFTTDSLERSFGYATVTILTDQANFCQEIKPYWWVRCLVQGTTAVTTGAEMASDTERPRGTRGPQPPRSRESPTTEMTAPETETDLMPPSMTELMTPSTAEIQRRTRTITIACSVGAVLFALYMVIVICVLYRKHVAEKPVHECVAFTAEWSFNLVLLPCWCFVTLRDLWKKKRTTQYVLQARRERENRENRQNRCDRAAQGSGLGHSNPAYSGQDPGQDTLCLVPVDMHVD